MADIRFMPTCSKCNRIIYETIDYRYPEHLYYLEDEKRIVSNPRITPNYCPYCGEYFERIVMATKLPFEPNIYDRG